MKLNDLYQSVTDRIIAEIEAGSIPWIKPWRCDNTLPGSLLPFNAASKRRYSGINILMLWDRALTFGFRHSAWLTFKQAKELGGQVQKGAKGTHIVYAKRITVETEEQEEDDTNVRSTMMLKTYVVFNIDQIDGLPSDLVPEPQEEPEEDRIEHVERLVASLNATIVHDGIRAFYNSTYDIVMIPPFPLFTDPANYYATLLHELGHWTGHESRLDRNFAGRFGGRSYAAEELVAELTAAFLCASLGIEGDLRHADYIENWLELFKDDNRAIFTAASKASKAADFLLECGGLKEKSDLSSDDQ